MSSLAKGPGLKSKKKVQHIGQYGIGKTLGQGSFSKVKLGTDVFTGDKVAIKIVDWAHVPDVDDTSESLEREIRIMKLFDHPNIVKLYDIISHKDDRKTYLIMEYVSRGELFDYIVANGRIKEPESRKYFRQLVSAVEYCHAFLVVHRDLKPSNLLLEHGGSIKLVDFGLSNQIQVGQLFSTWCGSLYYSAPEIIEEKRYAGPAVDMWSIGVILYALVNGRLPWAGKNDLEKIRQIVAADIAPAEVSVTDDCMDLIRGCLSVDPVTRFDMAAVREHRWTNEGYAQPPPCLVPKTQPVPKVSEEAVQQLAFLGFIKNTDEAKAAATLAIQTNERTQVVFAYHLLLKKPQLPVTGSYLPRDEIRAAIAKDRAEQSAGSAEGEAAPAPGLAAAMPKPAARRSEGEKGGDKAAAAAAAAPVEGERSPSPSLNTSSKKSIDRERSPSPSLNTSGKKSSSRRSSTSKKGPPPALKSRENSVDALVSDLDAMLRKPQVSSPFNDQVSAGSSAAKGSGGGAATKKSHASSVTTDDIPKSRSMSSSEERAGSSTRSKEAAPAPAPSEEKAGVSFVVQPGRRRSSSTSASIVSRRGGGGGSSNRPPLPVGLMDGEAAAGGGSGTASPLKYTDVLKFKLLGGRLGPSPSTADDGEPGDDADGGVKSGASGSTSKDKTPASSVPLRFSEGRTRSASVGVGRTPPPRPNLAALAAAAVDADDEPGTDPSKPLRTASSSLDSNTSVRMSSKKGGRAAGGRAYALGTRGRADSMHELPNRPPVVTSAPKKSSKTTAGSTWDAATYANVKKRRGSKGSSGADDKMRTVRGVFKCSTTSSRPPSEIMAAVEQALIVAGHFKYKRRGEYIFKCMDKRTKTRIEVECCMIEKLDGIYGVRFARVAGDTWVYKTLVESLMGNISL